MTYLTKTISGVGFDNENNIRKLCYLISNSYLPLQTIDTTSQGGIELALSHATPFEDDLGDWNEIHNRNERINELILEVFKTIYQKEEEK